MSWINKSGTLQRAASLLKAARARGAIHADETKAGEIGPTPQPWHKNAAWRLLVAAVAVGISLICIRIAYL